MKKERYYLCLDLKSFYASVECILHNYDPMTTNLVVADESRGRGAITLAITPAMKKAGVKNRCRLYEIPEHVDYICVKPRMQRYVEFAGDIYEIYLKYFAKEDIHVYSIDECFIDVTTYLDLYRKTPKQLAVILKFDLLKSLGIHCSIGVGTNMYIAKVAMDIVAKRNEMGIAYLDEKMFIEQLGNHQPLSDFFYIGMNIERRLHGMGLYTMNDIRSYDAGLLQKEFGINALYLYDHAKGKDGTLIEDIKKYKKKSKTISLSQILFEDYSYEDGKLILREMVEDLCIRLLKAKVMTNQISLSVGYSKNEKGLNCSRRIEVSSQSASVLIPYFMALYQWNVNQELKIRSIGVGCGRFQNYEQYTLFDNIEQIEEDKRIEQTISLLKDKYGKNSVVKGSSMKDKSTAMKRNNLLGGHNRE